MHKTYQLNSLKGKKALITGASSGIGKQTAILLAQSGVDLNLVARRKDRLEQLKQTLSPLCQVNYVVGDLTDKATLETLESENFHQSDICINNAGLAAGREFYENSDLVDMELMVEVNIKAVFSVSRLCLPWMRQNGGDLLNVSSIAGHQAYANGAIYCATKHAVRAFSEALRKETYGHDIRIMMLSPGMVETEFSTVRFKGDKEKANQLYQGMRPLTAQDMAHHIHYMLTRPRHVNIDDLVCLSTDQGDATTVRRRS